MTGYPPKYLNDKMVWRTESWSSYSCVLFEPQRKLSYVEGFSCLENNI